MYWVSTVFKFSITILTELSPGTSHTVDLGGSLALDLTATPHLCGRVFIIAVLDPHHDLAVTSRDSLIAYVPSVIFCDQIHGTSEYWF